MNARYNRRQGLALTWVGFGSQAEDRLDERLPPAWPNIPAVGKDAVLGVLTLQDGGRAVRLPAVPRRSAMFWA
ncbi:MAG: hypothetical protein VB032_07340 [Burkholderiaceae bacterium]|nr:hypothetical protein [Burkholderiaceae bacterium]